MFLVLSSLTVAAESSAVQQLSAQLSNMNSLSAHFTQTIKDSRGELLQEASGTLTVKRPRRFYWRTEQPYEHLVVTDGNLLWLYDIDLEQITKQKFTPDLDKAPALLLSGEVEEISQQYTIELTDRADKVLHFTLLPKSEDSLFKQLTITFSDRLLSAMSLQDSFDQLTTISFTAVKLNPEVPDTLFQFTAPDGIDVISDEP
ncbi:MAG TPA: outer membrane lipoprotein chaperone LolA [Porticoccus sp.]|nr:outer membrane lipoprotein chaperone LolA [Porticoccus sp.]